MKAILLAGAFVALALPTSASARPWAAFYCDKLQIALIPSKYFLPSQEGCDPCDSKTHYFDMKKDPDQKRPLSDRLFRTNDNGDLFYRGNKCREFTEKDYDALNDAGVAVTWLLLVYNHGTAVPPERRGDYTTKHECLVAKEHHSPRYKYICVPSNTSMTYYGD